MPIRGEHEDEPVEGPRSRSTPATALVLSPTPDPRVFVTAEGRRLSPPDDWICVPPGDAMLTRRLKQAGPSWAVVEKRGRKAFSRGLWVPRANVEAIEASVVADRSTEAYAKKRAADAVRREEAQRAYVATFELEVARFLGFAPMWREVGRVVSQRVAAHATPVGSGTVARTQRIPVAERAEAAVIAWMRHQTTAYDSLSIPRVAGKRREVRRDLAQISRAVLDLHRREADHERRACPLCIAVASAVPAPIR
jgi:hypothetical protein